MEKGRRNFVHWKGTRGNVACNNKERKEKLDILEKDKEVRCSGKDKDLMLF